MVEERPKYLGLGYGQSYGESSKVAMNDIEIVPRRSFISCPLPQECEGCIQEECNGLKHHLQDAGFKKHTLELESWGYFDNLEEIDDVRSGATSSLNSPPHEDNKGERGRYKFGSKHSPFDFVKHDKFPHRYGKRIACSFFGLDNRHCF